MGNNYETSRLLIHKFNELYEKSKKDWKFKFDYTTINSLFKEYQFEFKINFNINDKEIEKIKNELNILNLEYKEIEEQQNKDGLLTNSEMDKFIYKSWEDYISIAPFLYGTLSEKEVGSKRKLIQDSIEFYKNK